MSEIQNFVIPTEAERSERSGGTCFRLQLQRSLHFLMLQASESLH
jgi:hypothetical protein